MPNYFISLNGEVSGPYSAEYLKALYSKGVITNQSPCCPEGAPVWVTYGDLFSAPVEIAPQLYQKKKNVDTSISATIWTGLGALLMSFSLIAIIGICFDRRGEVSGVFPCIVVACIGYLLILYWAHVMMDRSICRYVGGIFCLIVSVSCLFSTSKFSGFISLGIMFLIFAALFAIPLFRRFINKKH
jgi:hypothetical protein